MKLVLGKIVYYVIANTYYKTLLQSQYMVKANSLTKLKIKFKDYKLSDWQDKVLRGRYPNITAANSNK